MTNAERNTQMILADKELCYRSEIKEAIHKRKEQFEQERGGKILSSAELVSMLNEQGIHTSRSTIESLWKKEDTRNSLSVTLVWYVLYCLNTPPEEISQILAPMEYRKKLKASIEQKHRSGMQPGDNNQQAVMPRMPSQHYQLHKKMKIGRICIKIYK